MDCNLTDDLPQKDIGAHSSRTCLKNHFYNLHTLMCGIFCSNSVDVARYAALIRTKFPTIYQSQKIKKPYRARCDVGASKSYIFI